MEPNTLNLIDSAPIAILTFNKNGEIDYANKSFTDLELLYGFEYPTNLMGSIIFGKELFPKFTITNELNDILEDLADTTWNSGGFSVLELTQGHGQRTTSSNSDVATIQSYNVTVTLNPAIPPIPAAPMPQPHG